MCLELVEKINEVVRLVVHWSLFGCNNCIAVITIVLLLVNTSTNSWYISYGYEVPIVTEYLIVR